MSGWNNYDVNAMGSYGNGGMGMGMTMPVAPMMGNCWGGGYGGGGGLFGGATGGAFVGGLAGSLVGDLFGGGGRGCGGKGGGADTIVQVNENGGIGGRGYGGGNIGQWEIMSELSDTRREVAVMPYIAQNTALEQTIAINQAFGAASTQISALQYQISQTTNATQLIELEGQYKALLTAAGISKEMADCCCKELNAITCMGYETQLRDQNNYGNIMKEMGEIKCLIKDTEKDGIIRYQSEKLAEYAGKMNVAEIKECMKPVAPVPAYIQGNPYENFLPTVKVARDCDCNKGCNDRWSFNNCR